MAPVFVSFYFHSRDIRYPVSFTRQSARHFGVVKYGVPEDRIHEGHIAALKERVDSILQETTGDAARMRYTDEEMFLLNLLFHFESMVIYYQEEVFPQMYRLGECKNIPLHPKMIRWLLGGSKESAAAAA